MDCRMLDSVGAYATRMMGRIAALFCRVPRYTPLYVSVSLRFPCPEDRLSSAGHYTGPLDLWMRHSWPSRRGSGDVYTDTGP